jgi:hypothetical protein
MSRRNGASAAPISRCRLLTSKVMATISTMCGGDVHNWMAANSEPPAKLSPVMSDSSAVLSPFWVAWAPSTSA